MTPLFDHIHALIERSGPMSLARFMELALQHPDHGYYKKGDPLGREGDFITAPEISQMFGELIGLSLAETWKAMGKPEEFILLELGPGRGTLMQDALRATAKIHGFHAAIRMHLLESSETLSAIQQKKLATHKPVFVKSLEDLPEEKRPILIVANEFFDALPIRQFEHTAEGWRERLVALGDGELIFILSPPDPAFLMLIPPELREASIGTVHEVSMPALTLTRRIAQQVVQNNGVALILDYGYAAHPGKGTLQAVSGHQAAGVLDHPGEDDLTAHIDFMALKHVAEGQGAIVLGPVAQGEYLQTLGIEMRAAQLKHGATPEQAKAIDAALRRLTDSSEMGALFKAMAIVSPRLGAMAGF